MANWIETDRKIYQGNSANGTLLQEVGTCYNGSCSTLHLAPPIQNKYVLRSIANGKVAITYTILSPSTLLPTEVDEYDSGISLIQPGTKLRSTLISYASLGNNIVSRRASATVCSPGGTDSACQGTGTGTRVAQTTYGYDEGSVTATSGISTWRLAARAQGILSWKLIATMGPGGLTVPPC